MLQGESFGCRERIALFGWVEVWLLHCHAVWTSAMLCVLCQWPGLEFDPEFGTGIGIRWGVLGMWDYSTKGVKKGVIEIYKIKNWLWTFIILLTTIIPCWPTWLTIYISTHSLQLLIISMDCWPSFIWVFMSAIISYWLLFAHNLSVLCHVNRYPHSLSLDVAFLVHAEKVLNFMKYFHFYFQFNFVTSHCHAVVALSTQMAIFLPHLILYVCCSRLVHSNKFITSGWLSRLVHSNKFLADLFILTSSVHQVDAVDLFILTNLLRHVNAVDLFILKSLLRQVDASNLHILTSGWRSQIVHSNKFAASYWRSELVNSNKFAAPSWRSGLVHYNKFIASCWRSGLVHYNKFVSHVDAANL